MKRKGTDLIWQHVALEEYWFSSTENATAFFEGTPKLRELLWEGSAGSYALAGNRRFAFEEYAAKL